MNPNDIRRQLDDASQVAKSVDEAITAAVPDIIDLQVAVSGGIVVISGAVPTEDARQRAEAAARSVEGVQQLFGSLTVA